MKHILRHYGSCGHIEDTESWNLFINHAVPVAILVGSYRAVNIKREVTEEENNIVVHVRTQDACSLCKVDVGGMH